MKRGGKYEYMTECGRMNACDRITWRVEVDGKIVQQKRLQNAHESEMCTPVRMREGGRIMESRRTAVERGQEKRASWREDMGG
eukprot:6204649-Pleurochrysis_carterae.AAC.1